MGVNFSVCLDAVFHGGDTAQAMLSVKNAGFKACEFWSWWDKDLDSIQACQRETGLEIAGICTKFVSLVEPKDRGDYLAGLRQSIQTAKKLNCKRLISQVGQELKDIPRSKQAQTLLEGLKSCLPFLKESGITLLVEPLNILKDHPGYFLTGSQEAFDLVDAVADPHVKVLFDIYHQQITEGNLLDRILPNLEKIGHFHAASVPGRAELDRGELAYPRLFEEIAAHGYQDFVGLEYFPKEEPLVGLRRLART